MLDTNSYLNPFFAWRPVVLASLSVRLDRMLSVARREARSLGLPLDEIPTLLFGSGTVLHNLHRVFSSEYASRERLAAAGSLRNQIRGLLSDPDASRAFFERVRECDRMREALMSELLAESFLLADTHGEQPQRIRLGGRYLKTKDGAVDEIVPDDLVFPIHLQIAWLLKEVRNAFRAILLARPYPPSSDKDGFENEAWRQKYVAGLLDFDDGDHPEGTPEAIAALAALRAVASRREREYMELLAEDYRMTNKEAAVRLGVRPGTISAMKARLKAKAKRARTVPL
jgi:DNA-binding CsgD family transcriptional regulator